MQNNANNFSNNAENFLAMPGGNPSRPPMPLGQPRPPPALPGQVSQPPPAPQLNQARPPTGPSQLLPRPPFPQNGPISPSNRPPMPRPLMPLMRPPPANLQSPPTGPVPQPTTGQAPTRPPLPQQPVRPQFAPPQMRPPMPSPQQTAIPPTAPIRPQVMSQTVPNVPQLGPQTTASMRPQLAPPSAGQSTQSRPAAPQGIRPPMPVRPAAPAQQPSQVAGQSVAPMVPHVLSQNPAAPTLGQIPVRQAQVPSMVPGPAPAMSPPLSGQSLSMPSIAPLNRPPMMPVRPPPMSPPTAHQTSMPVRPRSPIGAIPARPPPMSPSVGPVRPLSPTLAASQGPMAAQAPHLSQPIQPQFPPQAQPVQPQFPPQAQFAPQPMQPSMSQFPQMQQPERHFQNPMQQTTHQSMQNQFADAPSAINAASHQIEALYKPSIPLIQPNIDSTYFMSTHKKAPRNASLLSKNRLSYGISVTFYPFGDKADRVPEVTGPIVRCKRCRTYLNPFVEMIEMGARWRCNICFFANDFPSNYDYDSIKQVAIDRSEHPELKSFVYDFADAGSDYVARPPQPPVFVFALDVTATAVHSGMFAVACRVIQEQLDAIPNVDGRTRVAFLAYDQALHFFKISSVPGEKAKILVVADPSEPFLPSSSDLLVNLAECRAQIDSLLEQLPSYYSSPSKASPSLGPMLNAAHMLIKPYGGKIVTFLSNLPTAFTGALKYRADSSLIGTSKESGLLQPSNQFYKLFATDVIKDQICVDLFIAPPKSVTYVDIATISGLAKYTGGHVYYYPNFGESPSDGEAVKFASDLRRFLAQQHGYEAVLRIRCSKGLSLSAYHGSFFMRYSDLLSVPNVNPDHSFSAQISIDETLIGQTVYFQAALLHTTCCGERRIRVVNYAAPITDDLKELIGSIDLAGVAALMPNMAVEKVLSNRLEDAREAVLNKCADVIGAFKALVGLKSNPNLLLPPNLVNFPILMHALSKSAAMRGGKGVDLDTRAYLLALIKTLSPTELLTFILPRFYAIHSMDSECGTVVDGKLVLPPQLNLSSERLERHGVLLLDCHVAQFLWIGSTVHPELLSLLFGDAGVPAAGRQAQLLPELDNDWSARVRAICSHLRTFAHRKPAEFYIIREDSEPALKVLFTQYLIEDRVNEATPSYAQWLSEVSTKVANGTY